ncbi:MAG TPA: hypothetical protein ENJ00_00890, partial [Phycisphaerales bacterium]|nr:hypothetical protein [Phycisphaerales bacterium]
MSSSARMSDQNKKSDDLGFGPYELVRPLRPNHVARRYLALHPENLSHHVAYRFQLGSSRAERRRFLEAVESAASLSVPHILPVEQYSLASPMEAWAISPYLGDQDGLLTLSDLLSVKGGQMDTLEVGRVLVQLLTASERAHAQDIVHGPMGMDEILVDRSGAVNIELYGICQAMRHDECDENEVRRDEIRSVVNIAYELMTGVLPTDVWINPTRLVEKL